MNRVQQALDQHGTVAIPGIFDALSATIAHQAGFPLGFISGYAVSATLLGEPDMGLLTQTEMVQRAAHICRRVDMPILVDADTGYGNPLNVHRTVTSLCEIGASGCFLEDQVWPKRCGHMRGKQIIPHQDYIQKIKAAVDAAAGRDFFIVARTDALAVEGMDAAIRRMEDAREAGAHASFVEAPESREQLEAIGRRAPAPNVANMIEGGRTPVLPLDELRQLGFHLVMYPLAGLYAAAKSLRDVFQHVRQHAGTDAVQDQLLSFAEFNQLIGADQRQALAARYSS